MPIFFEEKKTLFIAIFLFFLALSCFISFIFHGTNVTFYFFHDLDDSFMDLFNSIYNENKTLGIYPALAIIPYRILRSFVPTDFWKSDFSPRENAFLLRASLYGAVILLIHILVFVQVFMTVLVKKIGTKTCKDILLLSCIILSGPILYSLQRGNNIIYAMLFSLLFFILKDSKSRLFREMALICLAIAACIKIYPALFGLCLLKDRQWKTALRCILYGLILFFLPMLFFKGGLSNFFALTGNMHEFSASNHGQSAGVFYNFSINNFFLLFQQTINKYFAHGSFQSGALLGKIVTLLTFLSGITVFFFLKKKWQEELTLVILCILIPGVSYFYLLIFLLIPLVEYIVSEDSSIYITVLFALVCSIFTIADKFSYGIVMVCLFLFSAYLCTQALKNSMEGRKNHEK